MKYRINRFNKEFRSFAEGSRTSRVCRSFLDSVFLAIDFSLFVFFSFFFFLDYYILNATHFHFTLLYQDGIVYRWTSGTVLVLDLMLISWKNINKLMVRQICVCRKQILSQCYPLKY